MLFAALDREARFAECRAALFAIDEEEDGNKRCSATSEGSSSLECVKVAATFAALDGEVRCGRLEVCERCLRWEAQCAELKESLRGLAGLRDELAASREELACVQSQFAAQTVEFANARERFEAEAEMARREVMALREQPAPEEVECCERGTRALRSRLDAAQAEVGRKNAELEACRDELRRRGRALAAARSSRDECKREAAEAAERASRAERSAQRKTALAALAAEKPQVRALRDATADADRQRAEATRLRDELRAVVEERTGVRKQLFEAQAAADAARAQAAASKAAASLVAEKARRRHASLQKGIANAATRLEAYCIHVEAQLAAHGLEPPPDPPDLAALGVQPARLPADLDDFLQRLADQGRLPS